MSTCYAPHRACRPCESPDRTSDAHEWPWGLLGRHGWNKEAADKYQDYRKKITNEHTSSPQLHRPIELKSDKGDEDSKHKINRVDNERMVRAFQSKCKQISNVLKSINISSAFTVFFRTPTSRGSGLEVSNLTRQLSNDQSGYRENDGTCFKRVLPIKRRFSDPELPRSVSESLVGLGCSVATGSRVDESCREKISKKLLIAIWGRVHQIPGRRIAGLCP